MLNDLQPDFRQIEHLPGAVANINPTGQITITTTTHSRDVINDPVRDSDLFEMAARMTRLTARLAP